jgi:hypothetical protein
MGESVERFCYDIGLLTFSADVLEPDDAGSDELADEMMADINMLRASVSAGLVDQGNGSLIIPVHDGWALLTIAQACQHVPHPNHQLASLTDCHVLGFNGRRQYRLLPLQLPSYRSTGELDDDSGG